ncbi:hypothetical protein FBPa1_0015 [Pseudomonas phage vB_PaeP_FBPa1]|nr:hypothetical protein FBPa1_0015 [Pseudomonas phage vB_PaeP_FBPa1]
MKADWVSNLIFALVWSLYVPKPASEEHLWLFHLLHFLFALLLWTAIDVTRYSPHWRDKPVFAFIIFAPMVPMNLYGAMMLLELLWN